MEVSDGAVWANWAKDRVTRVRKPPPSSYAEQLKLLAGQAKEVQKFALKFYGPAEEGFALLYKTKPNQTR